MYILSYLLEFASSIAIIALTIRLWNLPRKIDAATLRALYLSQKEELSKPTPSYKPICSSCGADVAEDSNFCLQCGAPGSKNANYEQPHFLSTADRQPTSGKIGLSYTFGFMSTGASLLARALLQEPFERGNLLHNQYYVGIDDDYKLIALLIPILFAAIISLLIVSDKSSGKSKAKPFIINALMIIISILIIVYDIPKSFISF